MDPQLLTYVQQARNAGMSDEQIGAQLRGQGWQEAAISEALGLGDAGAVVPELERPGGLPPGQYEPDTSVPVRSGSRRPLIIAGVLFGVLAIGAASFAALLATNTWSPLWSPFRPEPREVLGEMVEQSIRADVTHLTAALSVDVRGKNNNHLLSGMLTTEGDVDARDKAQPKMRFHVRGNVDFEGASFSGNGDVVVIGGEVYGRIVEFPFLSFLVEDGIEDIRNTWVQIVDEEYEEPLREDAGAAARLIKFLQEDGTFVIEELADDRINGRGAYHYRASVSTQDLQELTELIEQAEPDGIAGEALSELGASVSSVSNPGTTSIDVWIDKNSSLPLRLQIQQDDFVDELSATVVSFTFTLDMKYPGELADPIIAPQEYRTYDEISGGPEKRDTRRFSDLYHFTDALDHYYDEYDRYPITNNRCVNLEEEPEVMQEAIRTQLPAQASQSAYLNVSRDPKEEYHYSYGSNSSGTGFVVAATFEEEGRDALNVDEDGILFGCNCDDPVYCVRN